MVARSKVKIAETSDAFGLGSDDSDIDDFVALHERYVSIDEHALEDCLTQQSISYYEVSKRLALESSKRDAAKNYLREVEARVDVELRDDARKTATKCTETELASRRQIHEDVTEANRALTRFQYRVRCLEALDKAFSQRAYVIRDLCQLWIASYYGEHGGESTDRAVKGARSEDNKRKLSKLRKQ